MKSLFETIFALLFIGFILVNLPTIIGFLSLCIIIKCVYSFLSDASSESGNTQSRNQAEERHNTSAEYQQKIEEQKTKTSSTGNYSGYRYSHPHYSNDDGYDNSYYDDWQDDIPSEEGDGWHGTGNPFV
jgi:hypothetical protein